MKYFSAQFYYVRYAVLRQLLRYTFSSMRPRLWVAVVGFMVLYFINQLLQLIFRLIDEVCYRRYRQVVIRQPVFIISTPRSGTTYLHGLMTMDEGRFTYTRYAHTFFMSVSFTRFVQAMSWVDAHTGRWIRRGLAWLDQRFWGGWEGIHPMAFDRAEEDELPFAQSLMSPGVCMPFPFFHRIHLTKMLDREPIPVQRAVMDYYESSVKRYMYATHPSRTYLSKNVMSSGRLRSLIERFPDARFVFISRDPYHSVPSTASMFTTVYDLTCPDLPRDHPSVQAWAQLAVDFIKHLAEVQQQIPTAQYVRVEYEDLIADPVGTVSSIYAHFGWEAGSELRAHWEREALRHRDFQSGHEYSLAEFGMSRADIDAQLR